MRYVFIAFLTIASIPLLADTIPDLPDSIDRPAVHIQQPIEGGGLYAYTSQGRLFVIMRKSYRFDDQDEWEPLHTEIKDGRLLIYSIRSELDGHSVRKTIINLGERSATYGRVIPNRELDRWVKWKNE